MKLDFFYQFIDNDDPHKKLYPIRLLLTNEQLDELLKDKDIDIWIYFYINNSIKNVFDVEYSNFYSLNLSISYFLESENTLHFFYECCKNKKLQEILEVLRLSLQNFLFCLREKAFYSAFTEYRKCIEGILWINIFLHDPKVIKNNRIDSEVNTYSKLLKKYCPSFLELWKTISKLIHQNEKIIYFYKEEFNKDINNIWLNKFLSLIKNSSLDFKNQINLLFEIFEKHKYLDRYKKLLEYLDQNRKKYKLKDFLEDYKITKTNKYLSNNSNMDNNFLLEKYKNYSSRLWKKIMDNFENKKENEIILKYENFDIKKLFDKTHLAYKFYNFYYLNNINAFITKENIYNYISILYFSNSDITKKINNISYQIIFSSIKIIFSSIKIIFFYSSMIYLKEITTKENKNYIILKSYLEDILIISSIKKFELYGTYNSLYSFLKIFCKNEYKEELKKIKNNLKKQKHLHLYNRPIYVSKENKISGNNSKIFELFESLVKIFGKVLENIFNCDLDEINKKYSIYLDEYLKIIDKCF